MSECCCCPRTCVSVNRSVFQDLNQEPDVVLCEICTGSLDSRQKLIVLLPAVANDACDSHGDHTDHNPDLPTTLHVHIPENVFLNSFSHGAIVVSIQIGSCPFLMGCRRRFSRPVLSRSPPHLHVTPKPCRVHRQLLRRRSERSLPQPAGLVRADAEVQTRADFD